MSATTGSTTSGRRPSSTSIRTESPAATPSFAASTVPSTSPPGGTGTTRSVASSKIGCSHASCRRPVMEPRCVTGPAEKFAPTMRIGSTASTPGRCSKSRTIVSDCGSASPMVASWCWAWKK